MKKIVSVLAMAFVAVSLFAAPKIKVGIVTIYSIILHKQSVI